LIAILAILIVATALVTVATPPQAEAATSVKGRLRAAKRALRHSNHRLTTARAALAAAIVATSTATTTTDAATTTPTPSPSPTDPMATTSPSPTDATPTPSPSPVALSLLTTGPSVDELRARVVRVRRAVRVWERRVHRLARKYRLQQQMADWERRGKWMPIIRIAAAKYHVRAAGIYGVMMRESGGQRYAGSSSPYKGLFQYHTGTWTASWNPYRHDSIYDGSSQIFATCYAVSRGMGPSMWTTTFASQY
jgi:soluble lytic murein transglycosylase-like protein